MDLKLSLTKNLLDILNITTYRYAVSFDVSKQKYVKGLLIVDDNNIYVLINDKLVNTYSLNYYQTIKVSNSNVGGYLYGIKNNKEELIIEFSNKHYEKIASLAFILDIYLQKREFVENSFEESKCPKCGIPYNKGSKTCAYCNKTKGLLRYFLPYLLKYKWLVLLNLLIIIVSIFIDAYKPNLLEDIVNDYLITATFNNTFITLMIILGTLYLFKTVSNILKGVISPTISYGIIHDLRVKIYDKVQKLSLSKATEKTTGALINTISNDTSTISNVLSNYLITFVYSVIEFVALVVLMLIFDPMLTLYIIIPIPLIVIFVRYLGNLINSKYEKRWKHLSNTNDVLYDILSGIKVVKTYGMEEKEIKRFKTANLKLKDVDIYTEKFWATFIPIINFLFGIIQVIVYYAVGSEVLKENMQLGDMLKWAAYSSMLLTCASSIASFPRRYKQMMVSAAKIKDILQEENVKQFPLINKDEINGAVIFDDVSFGYDSHKYVLKNISFNINKGETIGIVGHSGAGKTTLINLLMKLYNPHQGKIYVDDIDVSSIDADSYRKLFGVVLQETYLFAGSIYENITYGNENATYEEVIKVCKMCNAHDFIIEKPFGYESKIGKHGEGLSGGEKQRVAIARALLSNPIIYILDEATSSLDTINEDEIQKAISLISKNKTTFIIAHRLSTLKNADKLIVLKDGKMVEFGTHEELVKKKGYYYGLLEAQYLNYGKK